MLKKMIAVLMLSVSTPALAYNIGYNLGLSQYKETSTLSNSFSFVENLSRTVSLNMDAVFNADRSNDLDRFVDGRTGNAGLRWAPSNRIELGATVSRTVQIEERFGSTILDRVDNTATGQIRYSPADWASLQIGLGSQFQDSREISGDSTIDRHDDGGVRNLDISIQKSLFSRLSSSFSFGEDRFLGDERDTGMDDLSARFSYAFPGAFDGGSVSVQLGASRLFTTYSDSGTSLRQQDWNHASTFTLPRFVETLNIQIGTGWTWANRYWDIEDEPAEEDPRDRLERGRDLTGQVSWWILDNLVSDLSFSRVINRSDKKRSGFLGDELYDVYEVTDDRLLNATLTYTPGGSRITFQRSIQLYRFDTIGSWPGYGDSLYQDNSDRDELREVLSLQVEIPVTQRLKLLGEVQGQNLETIYLKSEYSGNSRNSSTYAVSPGYEYDLGRGWDIGQSLKISADYTTYRFQEGSVGNDLLFRRMESSFYLQNIHSDSTTLGIQHRLRLQDQGTFEGSLYGRSEESITSILTLNGGFRLGEGVGITPSYTYEYSRRNFLASTIEPQEDNLHQVGLRARVSLGEGILSLNLRRTFYSDERPSYWNASVGFNYVI